MVNHLVNFLSHAYLQLVLDEESRKFTTINTQKGLFQYKRLPFGVSSAPTIFQRTMDSLLQGIPQTCVYLDDILITGNTVEEHLKNLDEVLRRLQTAGKVVSAYSWPHPAVEYLGHVMAITEAPTPRNVTELRHRYYRLGMESIISMATLISRINQTSYCNRTPSGSGVTNK